MLMAGLPTAAVTAFSGALLAARAPASAARAAG